MDKERFWECGRNERWIEERGIGLGEEGEGLKERGREGKTMDDAEWEALWRILLKILWGDIISYTIIKIIYFLEKYWNLFVVVFGR